MRPLDGVWQAARIEGLEPAGLVLTLRDGELHEGADVRLWFEGDQGPVQWSGTVIRSDVPLPGGLGVMVGLLTEAAEVGSTLSGSAVDLLLEDGSQVALLDEPACVTGLTTAELVFRLPAAQTEQLRRESALKARLAPEGESPCEVRGPLVRVEEPEDGLCTCVLAVELVERADLQLRAVAALRRLLRLR